MVARRWVRRLVAAVLLAALVAACSTPTRPDLERAAVDAIEPPLSEATEPEPASPVVPAAEIPPEAATTVPAPAPPPTDAPEPAPEPPATTAPIPRTLFEQAWTPFATVGDVVLLHPSSRVELIGYHEASHSGTQELAPVASSAPSLVLESRGRSTGARSAADMVVDPDVEIRSPVTGRVVRAGTYVLYCDHSDDYLVIEPDDRPGWEVKVLHIDGVQVRAGDRVEAGVTVVAPRPTILPFRSQVDDFTAEPSWPHVHIEVLDPSIPNRATGGRSC